MKFFSPTDEQIMQEMQLPMASSLRPAILDIAHKSIALAFRMTSEGSQEDMPVDAGEDGEIKRLQRSKIRELQGLLFLSERRLKNSRDTVDRLRAVLKSGLDGI